MAKLSMLAAVCDAPGEGDVLDLREVICDDPHEMEVRVKILTTGICRSDIHYLRGVWAHPKPVILGHEACGIVESVGPGVPKSRIGEEGRADLHAIVRSLPLLCRGAQRPV